MEMSPKKAPALWCFMVMLVPYFYFGFGFGFSVAVVDSGYFPMIFSLKLFTENSPFESPPNSTTSNHALKK